MKYIVFFLIGLSISVLGGVYINDSLKRGTDAIGGALFNFTSLQLAPSPTNGDCLTTDGSINSWSADCGSGGGGGLFTADTVNNVTFPSLTGTTTGTTTIKAHAFTASSTDTASLFNGGFVSQASSTFTGLINIINADISGYLDMSAISAPSHTEGRVFYDTSKNALSYYNEEADVTVNMGQESVIRVRNTTGATITNGQAVYISGATGANLPNVSLAQADARATARSIGLATHDIENNSNGYVTTLGSVGDLNTASFNAGDTLFLATSTAGGLTSTRPTTGFAVVVGYVLISHPSTGEIKVISGTEVEESTPATTDGGQVTYVTSATDDFAIGGTATTAAFYFDTSAGLASTTEFQADTFTGTSIVLGGDTINEFAGTGLTVTGNALTADLGTAIDTSEITDNTIGFADIDYSITLAGNPALGASESFFGANGIIFEGSTANTAETLLTVANPSSDITVTLPNITGTLASLAGTQTFTGVKTINANWVNTANPWADNEVADILTIGSGSTIANDLILEEDLKVVDSPVDEECLTYEVTTGDFEWQSCGAGGSEWTDGGDFVYPTGGEYAAFPFFQATSTTNSSVASSSLSIQANSADRVLRLFQNSGGDSFDVKVNSSGHLNLSGTALLPEAQFEAVSIVNSTITRGFHIRGSGTGSASTPTYSFNIDTDTGMYADIADELSFSAGGVDFLRLTEDTTDVATGLQIWDFGGATSFELPNSSDLTLDAAGEAYINTSTSSYRFHDGTAERQIKHEWAWGQNFASSTLALDGGYSGSGTTTVKRAGFKYQNTINTLYCRTDQGTAKLVVGNGNSTSTVATCSTSGATVSPDIDFAARGWVLFNVGTQSSDPNFIYLDITSEWTTD